MKFILNNLKEFQRLFRFGIIIGRQLVNIADLLIKPLLTGANVPDALQHFVKIVRTDVDARLEAFVINGEPFDKILIKPLCRPFTELRAPARFNAITRSDNRFQVIKIDSIFLAICGSCQEFLDNSIGTQLSLSKNIPKVQTDILLCTLKQLR